MKEKSEQKAQQKKPKNEQNLRSRRRTLSRLMAVQIFYQYEFFNKESKLEEIKNNVIDNYALEMDEEVKSYRSLIDEALVQNLTNGLALAIDEINSEILAFLKGEWTLEKLPNILLQILRFGAFELKFSKDIPLKVLINEYVDITACFFDSSKIMFANSVLENLAKKYRTEEFESLKK